MGGPLWTAPEEDYFWTQVVPKSDKRLGYDHKIHKDEVESWDTLAREMLAAMRAFRAQTGEEPLRQYNGLMLCESSPVPACVYCPTRTANQRIVSCSRALGQERDAKPPQQTRQAVCRGIPGGVGE